MVFSVEEEIFFDGGFDQGLSEKSTKVLILTSSIGLHGGINAIIDVVTVEHNVLVRLLHVSSWALKNGLEVVQSSQVTGQLASLQGVCGLDEGDDEHHGG